MIELTDIHYLGKGRTRECFMDPRDPTKCVKIDFASLGFKQTVKEAEYYDKLARLKPDLKYDFIPRFYGMVETNRGSGGLFDLVTDEGTGTASRTLGFYLGSGAVAADPELWGKALDEFSAALMASGVIVRDLNPGNLCARRRLDGSFQLVAIDGIGHRDFIPLCDFFLWIARRKLRRHFRHKGMGSIADLLKRTAEKHHRRQAEGDGLPKVSP